MPSDESSPAQLDAPSERDCAELAEVLRQWTTSADNALAVLDVFAEALETADLSADDPRLHVNFGLSTKWRVNIVVGKRAVAWLDARRYFIGLLLDDALLAERMGALLGANGDVTWFRRPETPGLKVHVEHLRRVLPEIRGSWRRAIKGEVDRKARTPYGKHHRPFLLAMLSDHATRSEVARLAYPKAAAFGAIEGTAFRDEESYDDDGDAVGSVTFSMDYALALERTRDSLSALQVDLLSAFCAAPANELSAGQLARLLGLPHHGAVNLAIVRLAKALVEAVDAEPPRRANGSARWWHVVAEGRYSEDRRFFWKLRPALRDAALASGICSIDRRVFMDDLDVTDGPLLEGAMRLVRVNAYERNPVARRRCIEHYGTACSACGIDLGIVYGAIAEGVIHVHHLRPLSECGGEDYEVDPITELRPVCPNCHVVLHRRQPPFTIDELQRMLSGRR